MIKKGATSTAAILLAISCHVAVADGPAPAPASPSADPFVIVVCRDRQDPGIGGTLVFDLARRRLVRSINSGPNILFGDSDVPVKVTPATIEWEVAQNDYVLDRATLELNVLGRIYVCQLAPRQL